MAKTSPELIKATQRFNQLFDEKNLKVDPFEKAIGVSQGTIKNVRIGRNLLSADCLIKIAKYWNVSADYLLCLTDEPKPLESRELKQMDYSVPAIVEEMPDLFKEQRFVNTAKVYNKLPDEYRERMYEYIVTVAVNLGINVAKVIGSSRL